MGLTTWQERLESHFANLHRERGSGWATFALEHGLDQADRDSLTADVRRHIRDAAMQPSHWMVWLVYAAELGYRYSGHEYWLTFARETPGWIEKGDREEIRSYYQRFHREFGGAHPSGPFTRFSIICWPITHAILPKDLQRHLARALFDVRHLIAQAHFEDREELGQLIESRATNVPSRFVQLAQQGKLLGQIASALLFRHEAGSQELILPSTLNRIAGDLERQRRSQQWLDEAQRAAGERLRAPKIGSSPTDESSSGATGQIRAQIRAAGADPRLSLRADDEGWRVLLELPNLSPLMGRWPSIAEFLRNVRCSVAGARDRRPLARGRVLSGSRRVELATWPTVGDVLLRFESSNDELDFLMRTECLLHPGPYWIFGLAEDGVAREIRSRTARPGANYVVVGTDMPPTDDCWSDEEIQCAGVSAMQLSIPDRVPSAVDRQLRDMGLDVARHVDIWPAGLTSASSDASGATEWRSTDTPRFGLRTDFTGGEISAILNGDLSTTLTLSTDRSVAFIELPRLSVGVHRLALSLRDAASDRTTDLGEVDVVVREPAAWVPDESDRGGMVVIVDPRPPTLEQFWEAEASIEIHAPEGRAIRCRISLYGDGPDEALCEVDLPPLETPVLRSTWREYVRSVVHRDTDLSESYDLSTLAVIELDGGNLGRAEISCERALAPLRWVVRREGSASVLILIDDRGDISPTTVRRYDFRTPEEPEVLDYDSLASTEGQLVEGGLYEAEASEGSVGVVVAARIESLDDLRIDPAILSGSDRQARIHALIDSMERWASARSTGDLGAEVHWHQVMVALDSKLFEMIVGPRWVEAERAFRNTDDQAVAAQALAKAVRTGGPPIDRQIARVCTDRGSRPDELRSIFIRWLAGTLARPAAKSRRSSGAGLASDPRWLSEFSLRLASVPQSSRAWAGDAWLRAIDVVRENTLLVRVARCVVLSVDRFLQPQPLAAHVLFAGWGWDEVAD